MFSLQGHNHSGSDTQDQSRSHGWRMLQLAFFYRLSLSFTLLRNLSIGLREQGDG